MQPVSVGKISQAPFDVAARVHEKRGPPGTEAFCWRHGLNVRRVFLAVGPRIGSRGGPSKPGCGSKLDVDESRVAAKCVDRNGLLRDHVVRLTESLKRDLESIFVTPARTVPDGCCIPKARAVVVVIAGKKQALREE